jgi:hypothetical protein
LSNIVYRFDLILQKPFVVYTPTYIFPSGSGQMSCASGPPLTSGSSGCAQTGALAGSESSKPHRVNKAATCAAQERINHQKSC